ncbi:hypothetical protein GCM10007301_48720 [Azorhizobium oxalatiphilum]|uniref:Extensin-like C-terminal domain-containing protein n=1 Tax=Azorhizobium oxalatiphilum TaxID=980631 RepID=A0A917CB42_9HYPH|nr:extensin family protein [Azorhizobium oxalatiphilum]GGF82850.1 hypothetical protein GCM10007301_48720 [Azorhizobium oxalatiphilum]
MIERRFASSPLLARSMAVLLLGACGFSGAQAAPDAAPGSLYSATPRMRGEPARPATAQATAPRTAAARAVPFPLPRPPDLGEEETDQAAVEEGSEGGSGAPAAPLPNPPSIYTPQQPYPEGGTTTRTFSPPPPIQDIPHSAAANEAPRGRLPAACAALVQRRQMIAAPAPPVAARPGCSLPSPVQLSGVRLDDGTTVTLSPAAILRCDAAAAITQWVREDLSRAAQDLGSPLDTVRVAASYDCRPRNRVAGAKMSDHGQGIAMDVGGVVLQDKRVFAVKDNGLPMALQASMKASMCARFTTVLGPGSDGYHEDHVHVDLAQRYLNIRLCRWEIRPTAIVANAPAAGTPASVPAATPLVPAAEPVAAPSPAAAPLFPFFAPAPAQAAEEEGELVEMAVVPLPLPRPAIPARSRSGG